MSVDGRSSRHVRERRRPPIRHARQRQVDVRAEADRRAGGRAPRTDIPTSRRRAAGGLGPRSPARPPRSSTRSRPQMRSRRRACRRSSRGPTRAPARRSRSARITASTWAGSARSARRRRRPAHRRPSHPGERRIRDARPRSDVTTAAVPRRRQPHRPAIDTITQVNAKALPKLNVGSNEIYVGSGDPSDTMVLWPDLRGDFWKKDVYDSSEHRVAGYPVPRQYTAVVYPSVLTTDAYLTYRSRRRRHHPPGLRRTAPQLPARARTSTSSTPSTTARRGRGGTGSPTSPSHTTSSITRPSPNVPAGRADGALQVPVSQHRDDPTHATGLYSARMEVGHRPAVATSAHRRDVRGWKKANRSTRGPEPQTAGRHRIPVQIHHQRRRRGSPDHDVAHD